MMVELIKRIVLFIFLSGIIFINIACSHNLAFNKNNLKQAEVNKYYEDLIKIEDINIMNINFFTNLPNNSGLDITIEGEPPFDRNLIKIQGTPKVVGNYQIEIKGEFRGGVVAGVTDFNKKYDLVINAK